MNELLIEAIVHGELKQLEAHIKYPKLLEEIQRNISRKISAAVESKQTPLLDKALIRVTDNRS